MQARLAAQTAVPVSWCLRQAQGVTSLPSATFRHRGRKRGQRAVSGLVPGGTALGDSSRGDRGTGVSSAGPRARCGVRVRRRPPRARLLREAGPRERGRAARGAPAQGQLPRRLLRLRPEVWGQKSQGSRFVEPTSPIVTRPGRELGPQGLGSARGSSGQARAAAFGLPSPAHPGPRVRGFLGHCTRALNWSSRCFYAHVLPFRKRNFWS